MEKEKSMQLIGMYINYFFCRSDKNTMTKKQSKENFMLAYGSRVPDVHNGGCAGLTKNGSYV